MAARTCLVTVTDLRGIRQSVEVIAESVFEAAARALSALRRDAWIDGIGPELRRNQAQAKRSPVPRKNVTTGQRMHIYGTTALGTGRSTITFTAPGGRQRTFSGRFVHLWMNRSGAWQMVCDEWYDDPATVQPQ